MDPVFKRQWLHALRAGQYKQTYGLWHTVDGCFCALGVLWDIGDLGWLQVTEEAYVPEGIKSGEVVPDMAVFGLTPDQAFAVMEKNDLERRTFVEVAAWVEDNL